MEPSENATAVVAYIAPVAQRDLSYFEGRPPYRGGLITCFDKNAVEDKSRKYLTIDKNLQKYLTLSDFLSDL